MPKILDFEVKRKQFSRCEVVIMQCREFREISESYISDELLVETNHQVNHHLEHCSGCRLDFRSRRELRHRVNVAGRNAAAYQIDPVFSRTLEERLRDEALRSKLWSPTWFKFRFLVPAMASLLLVIGFSAVYLTNNNGGMGINANTFLTAGLTDLVHAASGTHKECALDKLDRWEAMAETDYPRKAEFTENILEPLKAKYSGDMEMLSVHDCIFEGKRFTHVVVRNGSNVLSVLFDKSDILSAKSETPVGPIMSEADEGLQVAGFANDTQPVFVVSDLPETDNLSIARTISYSLGKKS